MLEFDYSLDYKNILFEKNDSRYRIGRGEQGVLLVRPYTEDICKYWRFKTIHEARVSSQRIYDVYWSIVQTETLLVWTCVASFLRWVSQGLADTPIMLTVRSMMQKVMSNHRNQMR